MSEEDDVQKRAELRKKMVQEKREQLQKEVNEANKQDTSSSSTSDNSNNKNDNNNESSSAGGAIREDIVQKMATFLVHPKVISAPESQKRAYLQQKGLTEAEINLSLKRAAQSTESSSPPQQQTTTTYQQPQGPTSSQQAPMPYSPQGGVPPPPNYYYYPPPPPQNSSSSWGGPLAGGVLLGTALAYVVDKIVLPWWRGDEEKEKERREQRQKQIEEKTQEAFQNLNNTLTSLATSNMELKHTLSTNTMSTMRGSGMGLGLDSSRELAELRQDMKTLKATLDDRKSFPSTTSPPSWMSSSTNSLPNWQRDYAPRKAASATPIATPTATATTTTTTTTPKIEVAPTGLATTQSPNATTNISNEKGSEENKTNSASEKEKNSNTDDSSGNQQSSQSENSTTNGSQVKNNQVGKEQEKATSTPTAATTTIPQAKQEVGETLVEPNSARSAQKLSFEEIQHLVAQGKTPPDVRVIDSNAVGTGPLPMAPSLRQSATKPWLVNNANDAN